MCLEIGDRNRLPGEEFFRECSSSADSTYMTQTISVDCAVMLCSTCVGYYIRTSAVNGIAHGRMQGSARTDGVPHGATAEKQAVM